jgi:hypothetical protein
MGLTTKEIENAKPGRKPYKLADAGGLCLLISPTGAKLWRWRYRFDGKEKMMALGEYPARHASRMPANAILQVAKRWPPTLIP